MGCNVFNNGKNNNCGFININKENIRKMIEEQKTNRNIIHSNKRNKKHRIQIPVRNYINADIDASYAFFVPQFRNRSILNNENHPRRYYLFLHRNENNRRNYSPRNRIRERNNIQPISINQIPREITIANAHEHSQRSEFERIDNQPIEQNEIDSSNNNNKSEESNLIDNFCEVKIKDISKLEESNKKCAICLERFNSEVEVIILPCIHIFHSSCINDWMEKQKNCPICKFELTKENIYQKNAIILEE